MSDERGSDMAGDDTNQDYATNWGPWKAPEPPTFTSVKAGRHSLEQWDAAICAVLSKYTAAPRHMLQSDLHHDLSVHGVTMALDSDERGKVGVSLFGADDAYAFFSYGERWVMTGFGEPTS